MTGIHLSLGSNIHPRRNLSAALTLIGAHEAIQLLCESSWYETRPWGGVAQANFLNLVCAVETGLSPLQLLRATQAIEHRLGRVRTIRNGPRTVDIDILLAGDLVCETPELRIPHPGLLERDFMLIPLLEIAPQAQYPGSGEMLMDKRAQLTYHQIIRKLNSDF